MAPFENNDLLPVYSLEKFKCTNTEHFIYSCMWLLGILKSRSYMDPQINPRLESFRLEAYLGCILVLTALDKTQFCSVPYRSLDPLQGSFRHNLHKCSKQRVFKRYNLALSKKWPLFLLFKSQNLNSPRRVFLNVIKVQRSWGRHKFTLVSAFMGGNFPRHWLKES